MDMENKDCKGKMEKMGGAELLKEEKKGGKRLENGKK